MKAKILIIMVLGVLLIGSNLYAGDLTITGKLGIGTTSPGDLLHLKSDAPYLLYERTGAYAHTYGLGFYFDNFAILDLTLSKERFVIGTDGNIGIGTANPLSKLHVVGYVVSSEGFYVGSDIRWKKNIMPLENSLENVLKLQGVSYEWRVEEYKDRNFQEGRQIGLIAQEVEKIIPELVNTDKEGYKSVSYEKLTAVLIEAMKEQQKKIKKLEDRISTLEK